MTKLFNIMETVRIIDRPIYLNRLLPYVGKNMMKVQCGLNNKAWP